MSGIEGLMKFINIIFDECILPDTRYSIDNMCNDDTTVTLHAMCPTCRNMLGTFENLDTKVHCDVCMAEVDVSNPSNPCFFAYIDPSKAIIDLIEENYDYYNFVVNARQSEKGHIKDIYDGKKYKEFIKSLSDNDKRNYVTLLFNTDGAPVFVSSKYSVWPVYVLPNEIPKEKRMRNAIVCALYFGKTKPEMSNYLNVFVENMNNLSTKGFACCLSNEKRILKIFPLIAAVDTIARAPMNGTSQFNGKYGCDWCLHPGEHYGGSMRYPFIMPVPQERCREQFIEHAQTAFTRKKPFYGVKNASPLLCLNKFDIVYGFVPEYMHCILSGVAKQYTEHILLNLSSDDITAMDDLLLEIKVPNHIGRLTRPLSEYNQWKAKEWENWLLYYSSICFQLFLSKKYIKHWLLLVEASYICLKSDIPISQLNRANDLLYKFVYEMENHFSLLSMTYNIHQLLHIIKSVYDWGPLWAHSAFVFESSNYNLKKIIHSAKGVILQIVRHLNIQRYINKLEFELGYSISSSNLDFPNFIIPKQTLKVSKLNSITYFGQGKSVPENIRQLVELSSEAKSFSKVVIHGCLFATSEKINRRSCNYYAKLEDNRYVLLENFIVDFEKKIEITVCKIIRTNSSLLSDIYQEVLGYCKSIVIDTSKIDKVCTFITSSGKSYLIASPNMLSY